MTWELIKAYIFVKVVLPLACLAVLGVICGLLVLFTDPPKRSR